MMMSSASDSGSDLDSTSFSGSTASFKQVEDGASQSSAMLEASSSSHTITCVAPCCDLEAAISGLPYQAKSKRILDQTGKKQGNKSRHFCAEWYKSYPWLVLCTTSFKAFCYLCKYCSSKGYLSDKSADEAFITNGFNNWKKAHERYKQHAKSNSHREAIMMVSQMRVPGIDAQLNKQLKKDQQMHRKMLMIQLSSLRHLLRQGLAIRGHDQEEGNLMQLLSLRSEDCCELKGWLKDKNYLSSEIINEMISLMSRSVTLKLLEDIRGAYTYSLIADEATDITNKEQLCISLRWVDKIFTIHEDTLELVELPKTDANTIKISCSVINSH